jgi:hypothetical protein
MKGFAAIGSGFVLPLPRFVFHPLTAVTIAVIHVYLSLGHLSELVAGQVQWVHIWKGFGALFGAYVFAALATRGMSARRQHVLYRRHG